MSFTLLTTEGKRTESSSISSLLSQRRFITITTVRETHVCNQLHGNVPRHWSAFQLSIVERTTN